MLVKCIRVDGVLELNKVYEVLMGDKENLVIKNVGGIWPIGEAYNRSNFIILSDKVDKLYNDISIIEKTKEAVSGWDRKFYPASANEVIYWVMEDLTTLREKLMKEIESVDNEI